MMLHARPVVHSSQPHNFSHSVSHELRAARNDQQRARRARGGGGAHFAKYVYGPSQSLLHTFVTPNSFEASWRRRGESTLKACASNGSRASSAAYNREFMALEFAGIGRCS